MTPEIIGQAVADLQPTLIAGRSSPKVERLCGKFYKKSPYGRPSMAPGVYFRCLLIGYFEGLDSERGIAWRTGDSLSLRKFLGYALDEAHTRPFQDFPHAAIRMRGSPT